ncbi:anti-sigma factor domain-containing protein [Thermostichus vulcanus]|uniref:Anti-sigma factor n=1 Tax=Thermostichus vulcanus str. 'Rupite' TaxID=2813851 RepID=A0ABT0CC97_THEVL|nr:anti-sigma factor [Thermostichus vulcanus]MCJ2542980.1 anti-sigma factor [Thermostichus vulcanus str. 'Rupite']
MAELTDSELMRQIQLRDRRSHFLLKDRYQKRLLDIALATLKQPHQAEEVVRQVFEFCWKQADVFDIERDRSVAVWLYQLTAFQARERLRRWAWLPAPTSIQTTASVWPRRILWVSLGVLGLYAAAMTVEYWRLRWRWGSLIPTDQVVIQRLYQEWQQQPDIQRATLRDPSFGNPTLVQALWSPRAKQVLLLASEMAPAPQGSTYQLWLQSDLEGGAQMLENAGTFTVTGEGSLQWLSQPTRSQQPTRLFITLEPAGGSESPTGSPLLQSSFLIPASQP